MSILIIEDDPDVLALAKTFLAAAELELIGVETGSEAFEVLRRDSEGNLPTPLELVVTDIQLPDANGIEICRRVRENSHFQWVPVIIMTAFDETENIQNAFASGALDFIMKPLRKDDLLSRVRHALDLSRAERSKQKTDNRVHERSTGYSSAWISWPEIRPNYLSPEILNFSASGLLFRVDQTPPAGETRLDLLFQTGGEDGLLKFEAVIVRVSEGEKGKTEIAVKFENLSSAEQKQLDALVWSN